MAADQMRRTRQTVAGAVAIVATLLLHTMLLSVAIWGGGHSLIRPKLPDAVGSGANKGQPDGEMGERRITVMLMPRLMEVTSLAESEPKLPEPKLPSIVEITGLDALPLPPIIDMPGEEVEAPDAQLMARANYAGMYESQVRYRIERAWELSEQPTMDKGFKCLVEILQQRDGRVKEVVLAKCDDSIIWRQSLVNAIQSASPLPAPPIPGAFVDRFSILFDSNALEKSRHASKAN
jgi:hypothetical protein